MVILAMYIYKMGGGHFAINTTMRKNKDAGYWWPTMHKDTFQFIKSCDLYQQVG